MLQITEAKGFGEFGYLGRRLIRSFKIHIWNNENVNNSFFLQTNECQFNKTIFNAHGMKKNNVWLDI